MLNLAKSAVDIIQEIALEMDAKILLVAATVVISTLSEMMKDEIPMQIMPSKCYRRR
tara:strand:- start:1045 stop:1215 length:171 start_codon:yes stop_codon:yes gene_type:complete